MKLQSMNIKFYKSESCVHEYIDDDCTRQDVVLDDKEKMIGCLNTSAGDYVRMSQMIDALITGRISSFSVAIAIKEADKKAPSDDVYTLYANGTIKKSLENLKKQYKDEPHLIIHELLMSKSTRYQSIFAKQVPGKVVMRKFSSYRCVPTVSDPTFSKTVSLEVTAY